MRVSMAVIAVLALATSLPAQTVAGRVVTQRGERALPGTSAALVDDSAAIVTRGRADTDGVFVVQAPTPGRYRLVLFVAGGGSFVSPTFHLAAGDYVEREFAVPEIPAALGDLYFATDVDRPAAYDARNRMPRYPESFRNRGQRGLVSAIFVVDTAGRIDMGTFQVLSDSPRPFVEAVRRILPEWTYTPAARDGVPVRQVVQLSFDFGMVNDPPRGDIVIRAIGITRVKRIRTDPEE